MTAPEIDAARRGGWAAALAHGKTQEIRREAMRCMRPVVLVWLLLLVLAPSPAQAFNFVPSEAKPAPELSFLDGEGNEVSLEDFRGKVVILNLWATWCAPCRKEMPSLDRLQAALGEDGLQVLPLSLDRGEVGQVETFYDEVGLTTLPIYRDPKAAAGRALGAYGLPTTIVLDREGREVGRLLGPAEWDGEEAMTLIRAVLAE
jgi:thiol-disulfide isomerase/thioredoxin